MPFLFPEAPALGTTTVVRHISAKIRENAQRKVVWISAKDLSG